MAREFKEDFDNLLVFINDYSLKSLLLDSKYIDEIKKIHKKYFSYLTFIAELQSYIGANDGEDKPFDFLKESCSDAGISFFLLIHGSYKPSKLLLRSSIETFLKGFCLDEWPDIDKEKNVFTIFETARKLPFFCGSTTNCELFDSIHQIYVELCRDVHTASEVNMANISALKHFPNFDNEKAKVIRSVCITLIKNYVTLLSIKYNSQYHHFHHRNKDIILESTHKRFRKIIQNIA